MPSLNAFYKSIIFKNTLLVVVVFVAALLLSFYGLMTWQRNKLVHAQYHAQFQHLVNDISVAIDTDYGDHIDASNLERLMAAQGDYQVILFLPNKSPIVAQKSSATSSHSTGLPRLQTNQENQYFIANGEYIAWHQLPKNHRLYAKFIMHYPSLWHSSTAQPLWIAALFVPALLLGLGAWLLLTSLYSAYRSWKRFEWHLSGIGSSASYEPLKLSRAPLFQGLQNASNRIAFRLHKQKGIIERLTRQNQELVAKLPEAVFRLDASGHINFVNQEFSQIIDLDADDIHQVSLLDILSPLKKEDADALERLLSSPLQMRMVVQHKYADKLYDLWLNPIYDQASELMGFSGVLHDVTRDQKKIDQLHSNQAKIDERLEANTRLWSVMGHELRTPLNGMIGTIQLLDETVQGGEQEEYLGILKASSDAMLHLLNDMLDLSKLDAGKMEAVRDETDILKLCRDVCELMNGNALSKDIELIFFADPKAPRFIPADAQRMRQVLLNMLGNAIKFTSTGHVALLIKQVEEDNADLAKRHLTVNQTHQWLCFEVQDTGPGISEEEQARLFSFFNQANNTISRRFGGTGLGLAISKGLVEMMGGFITLESQPKVGTVFKIYLPFSAEDTSVMYKYPAIYQNLYLMIFEANPVNQKHLNTLLNAIGIPAIMFDELTAEQLAIMTSYQSPTLTPIIIIDYDLLKQSHMSESILQNKEFMLRNKLLMSQRNQRSIPTDLFDVFDGFVAKPIYVESFLAEVLRVSEAQQEDKFKPLDTSELDDMIADIKRSQDALVVAPVATSIEPQEEPVENTVTVILAEDNLINQKVAQKMLQKQGFDVLLALNGEEVLSTLAKHPETRMIFMDCRMPKMDGLTATAKIRENKNSIPIIALTANDTDEDREACEIAGMDEFLAKPINQKKLGEIVSRYRPLLH